MVNLEKFDKYIENGLIKRQVSPCGRLVLFDYTDKCTYERAWDEVTLNARGTVYELSTGKVIARAFPKFFNWGELSQEEQERLLLKQSFRCYEKLDGSLGIVYYYDGEWRVNTRGSFTSEQAIKGKELLNKIDTTNLVIGFTYLVEIIYPQNRIVVDYNNFEGLVELATLHTETGKKVPGYVNAFNRVSSVMNFDSITSLQNHLKTLSYNEEGYVVQFSDGTRVKFKGDEYIKMHKLVTGMSPLTLWESMKNGKVSEELLQSIPEEFGDSYKEMANQLEYNYSEELNCAKVLTLWLIDNILDGRYNGSNEERKKVAIQLSTYNHDSNYLVFPILLNQQDVINKLIMRKIRPKNNIL